jgi:NADH pyrophosphatase NudC (nudix superfamily)
VTAPTDDHGGRVERAALDHVAGAPLLQEGQGQALDVADRTAAASTARRARSTTARPDTHCDHCGRRMSPGRHGRRRYCSNGCRQSAYKRRRRAAAAVEGVTDGNGH